jgi:K+-sensing histidine kinase KdpD
MDAKLAALVLHDVKNALGVLEGMLGELARNETGGQAAQAHRNCIALREKLIGFLTLYKASSQGLLANIEAVGPEDFLRSIIRERVALEESCPVSMASGPMPMLGFFDEHLVGLALQAALQNAGRFAKSAIHIGCCRDNNDLVFFVRDDGPGLGTQEAQPSTGLGMELCKTVAEAHRKDGRTGTVSICNQPGGGALFELRLP